FRVYPNAATMAFDDLLTDRKPNTRSRPIGARIYSLKNGENSGRLRGIDPDPIVLDREDPLGLFAARGDSHLGPGRAAVLDGISDKVLKNARELDFVDEKVGQLGNPNLRFALVNRQTKRCL